MQPQGMLRMRPDSSFAYTPNYLQLYIRHLFGEIVKPGSGELMKQSTMEHTKHNR